VTLEIHRRRRRVIRTRLADRTPESRETPLAVAVSIPAVEPGPEPAGEIEVEVEERFFTQSEAPVALDVEPEVAPPNVSPARLARRARLARVVAVVMGVGVLVCMAAAVRVGVTRARHSMSLERVAAASTLAAPVATVEPAPPPSIVVRAIAPSDLDAAEVAEPAIVEDAAEGALTARAAQSALERGRVTEAIALGERATELAPANSYAWLILGASQEAHRDRASARRSYVACVKATTGGAQPECSALLRR
jgi:hypothetical protein